MRFSLLRRGARNVRVFGSVARGEAGPESDLDIPIDLEPGRVSSMPGVFPWISPSSSAARSTS